MLNGLNDSEKQSERAKSKKGMQYYTTLVKEQFARNPDVRKRLKLALKREVQLLEKMNDKVLSEKELKELTAVSSITNKFLDKTFASQVESKNENQNYDNVIFNTVEPDSDGRG